MFPSSFICQLNFFLYPGKHKYQNMGDQYGSGMPGRDCLMISLSYSVLLFTETSTMG